MQRLTADLVAQDARTSVVEQHHVQLLRPVTVTDARPERRIRIHPLRGRRARQELEEHLQVAERGHELLDSHHGHEHGRQRRAHAAVPLGLDDADRPGLGDAEVGAADADARAEELLAQVDPRGLGEVPRVVRHDPRRDRARKQVTDLGAVAMDRGDEDV